MKYSLGLLQYDQHFFHRSSKKAANRERDNMTKKVPNPKLDKRIRWQEVCPTCLRYDRPNHPPECECCKENDITEGILCELTRMDQENDTDDFRCDAYQRKVPLQ